MLQNVFLISVMILELFGQMQIHASGMFELRLERFDAVDRSAGDLCCKDKTGQCAPDCNTYFRICLKHYQTNITPDPPCTFGSVQTPPLLSAGNGDVHTFPEKATTIPFPFGFTWPETFSLIIEAWHQPLPVNGEDNSGMMDDQLLAQLTAHRTLKVGMNWTEGILTNNSIHLSYSYRAVCDEGYFGAGCKELCRPREDHFGHYTCTNNGTRICLHGWTGQYCTDPICTPGCNSQRGFCEEPFECKCRTGWQGQDCSECIRYPGCQKGTCQQPWQCNCDEGWGGLFCDQDLNYCTHHRPCDNGGTCTNTGQGSYTCKCTSGFTGYNCEVRKDPCEVDPCKNAGICRSSGPGNYTCECVDGFSGKDCLTSAKTCAELPCANAGMCRDSPLKGYRCFCQPGYEGKNCEINRNDCHMKPCQNGGRCNDLLNSFSCTCPPGFSGATCQTKSNADDCSVTPCLNAGTCNRNAHGYTCVCPQGFEGALCQHPVFDKCADNPCHHGASCEDLKGGDFVCHCPQGFVGKLCDLQDDGNSIVVNPAAEPASTLRLEARSNADGGWNTPLLLVGLGAVVLVSVLLCVGGVVYLIQRKRRTRKQLQETPVTELNFNMNNFQKTYQVTIPRVPKEWKPSVTYQNDSEDYYAVLPKKNNANYAGSTTNSNYATSATLPAERSSRTPGWTADGIYMKVMVDPSSHYQTPRKAHVSVNKIGANNSDRFQEYELAENVRHQYVS